MTPTSKELDMWEWLAKVNERLTLIRLSVIEHREIVEDDYELLRIFHKMWYNGEYPLYEQSFDIPPTICQQQTLDFGHPVSKESNGIPFDTTPLN